MKVFTKDPDSVLDYVWDWTSWLNGDIIDTFEFIVPTGLTLESAPAPENVDGKITAWFSGGTSKASYQVTCRVHTVSGRSEDKTVMFVGKPN